MFIGVQSRTRRTGVSAWTDYATPEKFQDLFESKREQLFRLAMLLTASAEKAVQTLNLALRDCSLNGSVSTDWILPWARRAVIRNAIHLVSPPVSAITARSTNGNRADDTSRVNPAATSFRMDDSSIEKLPDFDRLVIVITVLEHISIQDCALLSARSPKDVCDAQKRGMRISSLMEHDFNAFVEEGAVTRDDKDGAQLNI